MNREHKNSQFMTITKNIMSFGASGRIERAVQEFEELCRSYQDIYDQMEKHKQSANQSFEKLVQVKVACVNSLKKLSSISKNLRGKHRDQLYRKLGSEYEAVDFGKVDSVISTATVAMNLATGVSTGVGTALGAWALVSSLGTASTGTAIAGLSGVAATNATLAWFGGGALAAGGGGMAVGTAVLGGVVAIPALAIAGILSHLKANKKINELQEKSTEVLEAIDTITGNIAKITYLEKRAQELVASLEKTNEVFNIQFERIYNEIYPHGTWSRLWKGIRKTIMRKSYFSEDDVANIAHIGGIAKDFANMIDTPVFEQEGA